MNPAKALIRDVVSRISPADELETQHQQDVLAWIDSDAPLFRIAKPDNPPKHLVSYFVLFDQKKGLLMLIDHKKAEAWLPTGGHVDIDEDPRIAAVREAKEELDIIADFSTPFGKDPLFVTVTVTKNYGFHTDVSLWYIVKGDSQQALTYDPEEMNGYKWLSFDEILATPISQLDPHLHRFVQKMQTHL